MHHFNFYSYKLIYNIKIKKISKKKFFRFFASSRISSETVFKVNKKNRS